MMVFTKRSLKPQIGAVHKAV